MSTAERIRPTGTAARLDQELTILRGAIAMVASGAAPSVTVGGLTFGEEVLGVLGTTALGYGVRLEPLWGLDCHGCDIRVRKALAADLGAVAPR